MGKGSHPRKVNKKKYDKNFIKINWDKRNKLAIKSLLDRNPIYFAKPKIDLGKKDKLLNEGCRKLQAENKV